jgi:hypothetical protein
MTERGNASCGAEVTSSVSVVFPLYFLCSTPYVGVHAVYVVTDEICKFSPIEW